MPEPAPRASRVLRLKRLLLVGIHGKGPPRERSERPGCKRSEAIFVIRNQTLGDYRVAGAPLGPVGLVMTVILGTGVFRSNYVLFAGRLFRKIGQGIGYFFQYLVAAFSVMAFGQVFRVIVAVQDLSVFILPDQGLLRQIDGNTLAT